MMYESQVIYTGLFLFWNNFNKSKVEQNEYSYQNINNWMTKIFLKKSHANIMR